MVTGGTRLRTRSNGPQPGSRTAQSESAICGVQALPSGCALAGGHSGTGRGGCGYVRVRALVPASGVVRRWAAGPARGELESITVCAEEGAIAMNATVKDVMTTHVVA